MSPETNNKLPLKGGFRGASFKELSALFSLVAAIIVALIALFTPPPGEIHESVLWFVAQLIMYSASIFGVSAMIEERNKTPTKLN